MRRHLLLILAGLIAAGGVAAWLVPRVVRSSRADGCVDRGGRWDSSRRACRFAAEGPAGRLRLTDSGARELGLRERMLVQIDSQRVPPMTRTRTNRLRGELGGDTSAVRYYAGRDGRLLAALVPSRSFESQDPHVVVVFGHDGSPAAGLSTYAAVEVYCPASGPTDPQYSARDSVDGCRYFHPLQPPSLVLRRINP
jgi:hypothetical protein